MRTNLQYLFIGLLCFVAQVTKAQTDPASLEMMISNHKDVREVLEARNIAELVVYNYHKKVKKSVKEYRNESDTLDAYRRAFDVIDLLLKGTATAFHTVNSYQRIKSNLSGYWKLIDTYNDEILSKLDIWPTDSILFTTTKSTIETVTKESKELYKSYSDFFLVVGGEYAIKESSTRDMMVCLDDINAHMDRIDQCISEAYLKLWGYMTVRLGFWKKDIFRAKSMKQIADGCYGRWVKAQVAALNCLWGKKSYVTSHPLGGGGLLGEQRRKRTKI